MGYITNLWITLLTVMHANNIQTCSVVKTLAPAYTLVDEAFLLQLFASCTVTTYSEQLDFESCVFLCQQDHECVAMYQEDDVCDMCRIHRSSVIISGDIAPILTMDYLQYYVSVEYLASATVEVVDNCSEVQESVLPNIVDSEYCLSLDGSETQGTRIYCHGTTTSNPLSYLTLPAGPEENFAVSNQNLFSRPHGRIEYIKIGIDLINMKIKAWDSTFAINNIINEDSSDWGNPVYGKAFSCGGIDNIDVAIGQMNIDLTGTGFYIPDSVTWNRRGHNSFVNMIIRNGQQVRAECSGNCGACVPSSNGGNRFETIEEQVIEVKYDRDLHQTACIPDKIVAFASGP